MCRSGNLPDITRADKTVPPIDMSFRGSECESRNLPELLVLSCGGSLSYVVDSSTPLRSGRNDIMGGRLYGFAYCFQSVSRCPAALIRLAQASQLPPREAFVPCFRGSGFPVRREGKAPRPSPSGKGDRRRRWMRRGTAFCIVGTTGAEVERIEKAPLALPLGELSPQVTERALRRFLNENVHLNHQR